MKAVRLRTEYLREPLGIDIESPRLMWNCEGGIRQTAYQIQTDAWDSGKCPGSEMSAIYPHRLADRQKVTWKIRLWDEHDEPGEWAEGSFEMGITSFDAKWICGSYGVDPHRRYPVDCFRKAFTVRGPVRCARLYITALGLYEAKINGRKAGDFCLAPGHTDYRKRVHYQTIDVTELLTEGENEITVQLADGWYRGSTGAWGIRNQYGTVTKLLAQLEITGEDGTIEKILTDGSWQWSNDGPIRFADNKDGEIVEAFRKPSYGKLAHLTDHAVRPTASDNVPVTEHETFHPVVTDLPDGKKILDFGQNIAGYIAFSVQAAAGQKLTLRFGEMLDADGHLTQKNIQQGKGDKVTPKQKIEYTCGEGRNDYKTTFAVFGFRYAELESEVDIKPENIRAIAVYSDMEETGAFESSNALLNRFVSATCWSAKSNSLDVPTDCPTRERHGWAGDAQIFFETGAYLFDYAAFSEKYLRDLYDWQKKDGLLPQIAPYGGVDFYMWTLNGSAGWSDAGILIPYRFFKIYGDRRILRRYYDRMKKYAAFLMRRCGKTGFMAKPLGLSREGRKYAVNTGQSYGEWAEPKDVRAMDWKDMVAPHPEVSTAYTAYVLRLMQKIAEELGHTEDAALYGKYADGCTLAYREMCGTKDYTLDTDRQARLVRPLALDLLDDAQKAYAKERLLAALAHYGWRLGTGFLSTPLILDVLSEIDIEAAYRLLENEEMPGWLFMPKNGATTIWESWEGTAAQGGIASLNHYSKGAVCAWLFKTMCGIRVTGPRTFRIAPRPGGHFTHAAARWKSIYGTVSCSWHKETGDGSLSPEAHFTYQIEVPTNCKAVICLPDGSERQVEAGIYEM